LRLAGAIALLFIAWMLSSWARRVTGTSLERAGLDATLQKFFSNLAGYVVLIVAVLACLGLFGVETTSFAALLAAAGLAIGLAFQGSLSNFAAGVMLLTFRPFKVGDFIKAAGTAGSVDEIEIFTTKLNTPDNRRIIVPNAEIFGSTIENITFHETRRVDVSVGTDYSADLDQTRAILEGVIQQEEAKLPDKTHQVYLNELGDSSVLWTLRVWTKAADYWAVRERLTRAVKYALDEANVGIPFPQMDLHIDGKLAGNTSGVTAQG
jgi:small conductance mechanosensitive channel